jgi:hypothetical protein
MVIHHDRGFVIIVRDCLRRSGLRKRSHRRRCHTLSKRWNESNEFNSSEQTTTTSWNQASLMKRATAMSAVLHVILAFACCNNGARSTPVEAKHGVNRLDYRPLSRYTKRQWLLNSYCSVPQVVYMQIMGTQVSQ